MPTEDQRPSHKSISLLHDWWERTRAGRPLPGRSELDPADLRQILPDLMVIDVAAGERGEHFFTYRLVGTRVDDRLGFNLKGMTVDLAPFGDSTASIRQQYETAVAERRPMLCAHGMVVGGTRYVEYERLIVPLASDTGKQVVALVAAVNFTCAYRVENGPPPSCRGPAHCDRKYLCVAPECSLKRLTL